MHQVTSPPPHQQNQPQQQQAASVGGNEVAMEHTDFYGNRVQFVRPQCYDGPVVYPTRYFHVPQPPLPMPASVMNALYDAQQQQHAYQHTREHQQGRCPSRLHNHASSYRGRRMGDGVGRNFDGNIYDQQTYQAPTNSIFKEVDNGYVLEGEGEGGK